jgi:hypothetical protein
MHLSGALEDLRQSPRETVCFRQFTGLLRSKCDYGSEGANYGSVEIFLAARRGRKRTAEVNEVVGVCAAVCASHIYASPVSDNKSTH